MTERLPDTWHDRDLPVLTAVVALISETGQPCRKPQIIERTGLNDDQVTAALRNLFRSGHLRAPNNMGQGAQAAEIGIVIDFDASALQITGMWPTPETALDRMIVALEEIAQNTDDEDSRTRAKKILDGLAGAGRQIGISVAAAALTGQVPGV